MKATLTGSQRAAEIVQHVGRRPVAVNDAPPVRNREVAAPWSDKLMVPGRMAQDASRLEQRAYRPSEWVRPDGAVDPYLVLAKQIARPSTRP